jgi:hypothetical protein
MAGLRKTCPTFVLSGSNGINLFLPTVVVIADIAAMVKTSHEIVEHLYTRRKLVIEKTFPGW